MSPPCYCDFCGRPFPAFHWNQRTCTSCASHGAPDQSKPGYEAALRTFLNRPVNPVQPRTPSSKGKAPPHPSRRHGKRRRTA